MPTYQHNLSEVVIALEAKISALEGTKNEVQQRINAGKSVSQNTAVLQKINDSLGAAQSAKSSIQSSCCIGQNCNFDYYD